MKLELPTLEQISAGLIEISQRQGRLYPYPQNLQLGYDTVVLAFFLSSKPQSSPASVPEFYQDWCEKPFEEWGVEVNGEIDGSDTLLFLGEPTELTIELAEAFGGSTLSQEQSRIATILLQRCQVHSQGAQIYTKFRRFIVEHPVLSDRELLEAKGDFGLGIGLSDLLEECYEIAPRCYQLEESFYACPYCHALAAVDRGQAIANPNCNRCPPGRRLKKKVKLSSDSLKLKRGIERFWFYPGRAEIRLYEKLTELGLQVELYPERDRYDLRVTFPDGKVWALDLKDYFNPYLLVKRLGDEPIPKDPPWDEAYIVIPNERKKDRPAYLKELKSRWRTQDVKPVFDDAIFALAKKKLGKIPVQRMTGKQPTDNSNTSSSKTTSRTKKGKREHERH
jgi:REase associating with pPIWI_RE/pPIWI_RE three-gene island domain Y